MTFRDRVSQFFREASDLFWRKSADYGTDNIAETGPEGVITRLLDKIHRAQNLLATGQVENESLYDTALDITNYGVILGLLISDKWPRKGENKNALLVKQDGHENISSPQKLGDVGYDLRAARDTLLVPLCINWVPTGVRVKCPSGYWCRIAGRSSFARLRGILVNEGVIDEGYTGELEVACVVTTKQEIMIRAGERIGQLIFFRAFTPEMVVVEELPRTERGDSGFGSTGRT